MEIWKCWPDSRKFVGPGLLIWRLAREREGDKENTSCPADMDFAKSLVYLIKMTLTQVAMLQHALSVKGRENSHHVSTSR